ncbi:unnamed protein product, partial [Staurois parvus]
MSCQSAPGPHHARVLEWSVCPGYNLTCEFEVQSHKTSHTGA